MIQVEAFNSCVINGSQVFCPQLGQLMRTWVFLVYGSGVCQATPGHETARSVTTVCLNLPQADGRLLSLWRTIGVLHTDMAGNALAQRSTRAQNFDAGTQNACCF